MGVSCVCTRVMGAGGNNYQLSGEPEDREGSKPFCSWGWEAGGPGQGLEVVRETGHFLPLPWGPPRLSRGMHCM